jgi:hypothetical protein
VTLRQATPATAATTITTSAVVATGAIPATHAIPSDVPQVAILVSVISLM